MQPALKLNDVITFPDKVIDVLTIGEMLVDMISSEYDNSLVNNHFKAYFGGAPANITMNVNRLGGNSSICAAVGNDRFGDFLINQLKKQNIDTKLIQCVKQSTSMVVVNKSKDTPIPTFYRGADYYIQLNQVLRQAIKQTKIVHFSSWPISKPSSRKTIKEALAIAREAQAIIGFDPNYHSELWDDSEDGIKIMKEMIGQVDIIKPSEDDAERLFGPDTPENQIDKCHHLGCKFVIMTLGEKGSILSINGNKTYYQSKATKVVDTTGAGDAFWSGFYTGITKGETMEAALNIGFLTSAYKLQYSGAVVDLPHYQKLLDEKRYRGEPNDIKQ